MRYYGEYGEDVIDIIDLTKLFRWVGDKFCFILFGLVCKIYGHRSIIKRVSENGMSYDVKSCKLCNKIIDRKNNKVKK